MIVLDSSALLDLLLGSQPNAGWVEDRVKEADGEIHAPHIVALEVVNVARRLLQASVISLPRARALVEAVAESALQRYPHTAFLDRIWELRENVDPFDASYVALAEALDVPLVTTDRRLARAPGIRATVLAP